MNNLHNTFVQIAEYLCLVSKEHDLPPKKKKKKDYGLRAFIMEVCCRK
jgi:hypothetical protein